jgi:hypothetical protein
MYCTWGKDGAGGAGGIRGAGSAGGISGAGGIRGAGGTRGAGNVLKVHGAQKMQVLSVHELREVQ